MSERDDHSKRKQGQERQTRHTVEWTVLGIASLIVFFMIGYSVYHGIITAGDIPRLRATPQFNRVIQRDDRYILPIQVRNTSRPTAEDVVVAVTVFGDELPQVRTFRINVLPEHGALTGYIHLQNRPTPKNIQAEIESFRIP